MTPEERIAAIREMVTAARAYYTPGGQHVNATPNALTPQACKELSRILDAPEPEETPIEWDHDVFDGDEFGLFAGCARFAGEGLGHPDAWIEFTTDINGDDPARVRLFCERVVRLLNEVQP